MATIEPVTRTIVEESFVMTFSRAELQAFVKDPRPFLRDVRHVLNGSQMKPLKSGKRQAARRSAETGKKNTASKRGPRSVKEITAQASDEKKFRCERCEARFKTQGWLNQHEYKAHGVEHSGDVEIGKYGANGDD